MEIDRSVYFWSDDLRFGIGEGDSQRRGAENAEGEGGEGEGVLTVDSAEGKRGVLTTGIRGTRGRLEGKGGRESLGASRGAKHLARRHTCGQVCGMARIARMGEEKTEKGRRGEGWRPSVA